MHPDIIDINMGCPVPKVALRAQAGSALLKNPDKIGEIVRSVVNAVGILMLSFTCLIISQFAWPL